METRDELLLAEAYKKISEKSEKLDPVGEEDDDVNNDGKVDSTDKYLKKRRQAVSRSVHTKESNLIARAYEKVIEANHSSESDK